MTISEDSSVFSFWTVKNRDLTKTTIITFKVTVGFSLNLVNQSMVVIVVRYTSHIYPL